jgi:hypothetical protein
MSKSKALKNENHIIKINNHFVAFYMPSYIFLHKEFVLIHYVLLFLNISFSVLCFILNVRKKMEEEEKKQDSGRGGVG